MTIKSFLKDIGKGLIEGTVKDTMDDVKTTVKDTMDDVEERTKRIVKNVVKSSIVILIMLIGTIFTLSGLGKFLSETVKQLNHGLGFVFIGVILLLFGIVAKVLQKD